MKKWLWIAACWAAWMMGGFAQNECAHSGCISCEPVARPPVEVHEAQESYEDHEGHNEHEKETHTEAESAAHADHTGHDHAGEEGAHDDHGSECGGHADESRLNLSPEMTAKLGLKLATASSGTLEQSMIFPVEISRNHDQSASVSPRYPSVIRQVFAEIGDVVRKGDVLASLENRETLAVYTVASPLDGVIVSKDLATGEFANEQRILFEVADLSSVWADITVFPKVRPLIKKGMTVEFLGHDGHSAHGTIHYVSPIISRQTRTFTARCVLHAAGEAFAPGAFARARIVTRTATVRVRVEREAVQMIEGEAALFVANEHGLENRDVVLGLNDAHYVEIKQGLRPGERYVAVGAFALKAELLTSGMDPHAGHGH